ncbi:MAG TPA: thiosulfate sulfurtransferase GlpE, partial [Pseudomonas sp.]|nr:thiosulfate sulfurtransferase GlpE [Pseudomonas sp.]
SRHLDNHSLPDFIAQADFDQPLIVACYHGNSSQSAAAYLAHQGFSEVYSLNGGFELWHSQYPDQVARGEAE